MGSEDNSLTHGAFVLLVVTGDHRGATGETIRGYI